MTFTAEIQNGHRSYSFVYFDADSRGAASVQLDHFLRAMCIDPERVVRFGTSFDRYLGEWELTHQQELVAELATA